MCNPTPKHQPLILFITSQTNYLPDDIFPAIGCLSLQSISEFETLIHSQQVVSKSDAPNYVLVNLQCLYAK